MRISDWSSDVCSSDLLQQAGALCASFAHADDAAAAGFHAGRAHLFQRVEAILKRAGVDHLAVKLRRGIQIVVVVIEPGGLQRIGLPVKSEEHTSELQSLMRISYAVFCLKNKNKKHRHYIINTD